MKFTKVKATKRLREEMTLFNFLRILTHKYTLRALISHCGIESAKRLAGYDDLPDSEKIQLCKEHMASVETLLRGMLRKGWLKYDGEQHVVRSDDGEMALIGWVLRMDPELTQGAFIKLLIDLKGLTRKALEEKAMISSPLLSRLTRGEEFLRRGSEKSMACALFLDVPEGELLNPTYAYLRGIPRDDNKPRRGFKPKKRAPVAYEDIPSPPRHFNVDLPEGSGLALLDKVQRKRMYLYDLGVWFKRYGVEGCKKYNVEHCSHTAPPCASCAENP